MSIRIVYPGLLTTVQDLGRFGYQHQGVNISGAMDAFALRIANLLVNNEEGEAVLEITLMGPEILFEKGMLVSICGGNLSPTVEGKPAPLWRPIYVKAGSTLKFGSCKFGARAYVAVCGGIQVLKVMGSRSTNIRAGIGGHEGRALMAGDILEGGMLSEQAAHCLGKLSDRSGPYPFSTVDWFFGSKNHPSYGVNPVVRVIRGREYEQFTAGSKDDFLTSCFQVSPQSDRMGYRLNGAELQLKNKEHSVLISGAVTFGTIQVPKGGNPIILMADCQTIGGYPRIAQVITVDLPILAQLKPGDRIQFAEITLQEAENLYIKREEKLSMISKAISLLIRERG